MVTLCGFAIEDFIIITFKQPIRVSDHQRCLSVAGTLAGLIGEGADMLVLINANSVLLHEDDLLGEGSCRQAVDTGVADEPCRVSVPLRNVAGIAWDGDTTWEPLLEGDAPAGEADTTHAPKR